VNLSWIWLNEAALIVAERLASDRQPYSDDAAAALDNARKELLSWARRGSLEIQGKYWSLPEAAGDPSYLDDKDWISLKSSLWKPSRLAHFAAPASRASSPVPEHQLDGGDSTPGKGVTDFETLLSNSQNNPLIKSYDIVVDWDLNSLTFEDNGDPEDFHEPYGYCDLRVRALEIDQIIPPPAQYEAGNSDTGNQVQSTSPPPPKNRGGAPRKFVDDLLIEIIRIANHPDGLPDNKEDLVRLLREYNCPSWGENIPSESTRLRIATMVYERIFPHKP
jgi:hypothetical protein